MNEIIKLLIGMVVLIMGIPIGNFLARLTKEELKERKAWFKILIIICLIGGFISLLLKNDIMLFTLFFIAIVTSRSIRK